MTYDHTEIDLEDSTPGNVSFIGSDRATVAGHSVIVKYVASKAVSQSTYLTYGRFNTIQERDRELSDWWKIKYVLRSLD